MLFRSKVSAPASFDNYILIYQGKQELAKILFKLIFDNDKIKQTIRLHDTNLTFQFKKYQLSIVDFIYMLLFSDMIPSNLGYELFFNYVKTTVHIPRCLIQNTYFAKKM